VNVRLGSGFAAMASTWRMTAVYYYTSDLALSAAGFSLRVRRNDDALLQTLKRDAEVGGVATARGEWEWEISGEPPDLNLINAAPAAALSEAELQPAFEEGDARSAPADAAGRRGCGSGAG
jgi:inorganic triphosphatase YgiF